MKKVFGFIVILATMLFTGCFSDTSKDETTEKKATKAEGNYITVYYDNPTWLASANDINIHYNAGNGWTAVPGIKMTKITNQYSQWGGWATATIGNASSLTFCFNNGTTWDNNSGKNYTISSPGVYTVKNGVVTKQGITIDLYAPLDGIYPSSDLGGLPVTLYKDNVVYATSTINYTTKSGIYATFKNILPGNYKIVINTEINSTYDGRILLKGENAFTITNTMTYYAGNITFTKIAADQGYMSVNFSVADSNVRKTPLIGQSLKVYKDGVYFKDLTIEQYSYFMNEIYASLRELNSGNYRVVLDTTVNNVRYTGEGSIKIDGASPNEQTVNLVITATPLNTITVYYDNPTWFSSTNNINIHYNAGNGWTAAPGVAMTKITDYYGSWGGWAKMTVNASTLTFCFNNGSTWDNNSGKNYSITAAGVYTVKNGAVTLVK